MYIPYADKLGLSKRLGWMSFETKDWQDVIRVFYHKSTPKNNPKSLGKPEGFERLFLTEEREKYKLHNKTKLEIATDKALKLAGYPGFI